MDGQNYVTVSFVICSLYQIFLSKWGRREIRSELPEEKIPCEESGVDRKITLILVIRNRI